MKIRKETNTEGGKRYPEAYDHSVMSIDHSLFINSYISIKKLKRNACCKILIHLDSFKIYRLLLFKETCTHRKDIPSAAAEATITFIKPFTFSSFMQSANTCGICFTDENIPPS